MHLHINPVPYRYYNSASVCTSYYCIGTRDGYRVKKSSKEFTDE